MLPKDTIVIEPLSIYWLFQSIDFGRKIFDLICDKEKLWEEEEEAIADDWRAITTFLAFGQKCGVLAKSNVECWWGA